MGCGCRTLNKYFSPGKVKRKQRDMYTVLLQFNFCRWDGNFRLNPQLDGDKFSRRKSVREILTRAELKWGVDGSVVILRFLFPEIYIKYISIPRRDETRTTTASFQLYRVLMVWFYGNRCKLLPAVPITFPLCSVKPPVPSALSLSFGSYRVRATKTP